MPEFIFNRTDLAKRTAESFFGEGLEDHIPGLFLAAPRRTGKTHFIRSDLIPEMERRGVVPIYVDLWSDMNSNPASLVIAAIQSEFRNRLPRIVKLAKKIGISKVGTGQVSMDIDKIGMPDGHTLVDAFKALIEVSKKPIFLAIDEAQRSLETDEGINVMFALKSARDTLNVGGARKLMLAFTGSQRDKLAKLIDDKRKPFYGARIVKFPSLDRKFTDSFTEYLNGKLDAKARFSPDATWKAFETLGYRPEKLKAAISETIMSASDRPGDKILVEIAADIRKSEDDAVVEKFMQRTPVERAVLSVLAVAGDNFTPFSRDSLSSYSRITGRQIEANEVQKALDALRSDSILWREARGAYTFEDESWQRIAEKSNSSTFEETPQNQSSPRP
jgi:hypothetical protein